MKPQLGPVFKTAFGMAVLTAIAMAQPGPPPGPPGPGGFPPGGRGGGPGFGGVRPDLALVDTFDKNGDGWLDSEERKAARTSIATQPRPRGFGRRGGVPAEPAKPGRKLTPADVKKYGAEPLYDGKTIRTFFLEFENPDWEKELADFYHTDVEVPAKLTVDGKVYPDVGVAFRGMSSFMMAPETRKRSLNISMDFRHKDQRLNGFKSLNLLNGNGDPTFLRAVLYLDIARAYIPAARANLARVAINGENWGIYGNVEQVNNDFIRDRFGKSGGARWKVPGSPMGRGGLAYLGDDPTPYRQLYEIKTKDTPKSWAALIQLCKVLNETPPDKLEAALAPLLDIDETLKFLALDKALINSDGYWVRASDYNIYMNPAGRFSILPHDVNEGLRDPEGPGFRRGGGGEAAAGGSPMNLDPFAGETDPTKALLHRLLAVPAFRNRYLGYVREIAEKWLDWNGRFGKLATGYHALIAADVADDTRKLYSTEAFTTGLAGQDSSPVSLKRFADERRKYLLSHPEVSKAKL